MEDGKSCKLLTLDEIENVAGGMGRLEELITRIKADGHARELRELLQTQGKPAAAIVSCRRGGASAAFDQLNKYFTICGMPVASGQYWNGIHGRLPGEASQDEEGMQQMRTLAHNMVFLMKSIELGKQQFGLPEKEPRLWTHFIND